MNDERFLKDWLRETTSDTTDAQVSADRIVARVAEIRQRSRWWSWLPVRGTRPPPADDHQPPTASGRTRLMFSPVKVITAGALVFALCGAFLVAQPSAEPEGGVPGAEQAPETAFPVAVVGTFIDMGECTGDEEASFTEYVCEVDMEWSDPRLQGTDTYLTNSMNTIVSDQMDGTFDYRSYIIETDAGTWRMRPQLRVELPDWPDPDSNPWWWVLDGDGAYDGLTAVLTKDRSNFVPGEELHGFIFSSDLVPPPPEVSSTR